MAFTSNRNLTVDNSTQVTLRDWQHAAKMFNVDQFRLAPKQNFLFHVSFGINVSALKNANIVQRYGNEINMLVKAVSLPSFTVQTEVLNQYNRKKVMQYQHKAGEVDIKFHDDNMGLINQLWQNYYSYYYADSTSAKSGGAYSRNATRSSNFITTPYGLDNNSVAPFFNYIKVYQMARHEFVCYQLINPLITSWNHNKLDYSDSKTHEFDMKLLYEAVNYSVGQVEAGTPEGFGVEHYDLMTSQLVGTNPDPTIISPSFVQALDIETIAPGILNNAINTVNGYQNTKSSQTQVGNPSLSTTTTQQTTGGVNGVAFPTAAPSNTTVARSVQV